MLITGLPVLIIKKPFKTVKVVNPCHFMLPAYAASLSREGLDFPADCADAIPPVLDQRKLRIWAVTMNTTAKGRNLNS
jgi:hypothetical protein